MTTMFNNYARSIGKQTRVEKSAEYEWFEWEVFVDETPDRLERIRGVEYHLHPTFPRPIRTVEDRSTRFALRSRGWGEFAINIRVQFKDGTEEFTRYDLSLRKPWPANHQ